MKLVDTTVIEECIDRGSVVEYRFDRPWTRETVAALKPLGSLEHYANAPRPFFRIKNPGGMTMMGIEGERSIRVTYPKRNRGSLRQTVARAFDATSATDQPPTRPGRPGGGHDQPASRNRETRK